MEVNVNRVVIEGRMCAMPQVSSGPAGVVTFARIASADDYKKRDGEVVERTNFFTVRARNAIAEILRKAGTGDRIIVDGKLTQEVYRESENDAQEHVRVIVDAFLVRLL